MLQPADISHTANLKFIIMELQYESKFSKLFYDAERSFIKAVRKGDTENMSDEDYRNDMLALLDILKEKKATHVLMDNSEFHFTIAVELQDWASQHIVIPAAENGLRRLAFIESDDIFANVSSRQAMEVKRGETLTFRYFDDKEKAVKWLFED